VGEEIERLHFSAQDFHRFEELLAAETDRAQDWMRAGRFDEQTWCGGFELEAWLLDHNFFPEPRNEELLTRLSHPLVVPELSRFNIELNGTPQELAGQALRRIEQELTDTWRTCAAVARDMGCQLAMIGTLPTIREQDLTLANISRRNRYYALNEQVLRMREGRPFELDIRGREHLRLTHDDVLLEAGTTSFQVHLQAPASEIHRYYNAAQILSAPLVALGANSPFLFGHDLWDETRIALFEQSVAVGQGPAQRVTFGTGYLQGDPTAIFRENQLHYPVALPIVEPDATATLRHLRLHNGTIWRWNRLLMGFDNQQPHLRVEHRVLPAGPSIVDQVSNAAVYLGASRFLAGLRRPPEEDLPFETARENFYAAARDGIAARVRWLDGREIDARSLLLDEILHMAREGLLLLGMDADDIYDYIGIAETRVRTGQNGAAWQRAHVAAHGRDFFRLVADYLAQQHVGNPVHEWPV
jgi:gamma-glutamyl:cysteine ligase YbdK (ATP-grasp superfamily)